MSQTRALELLRDAIALAKANEKSRARDLLREAASLEANNENIWLWLGGVTEQPLEAVHALEQALKINPNNERVRTGLNASRLNAGIAAARANQREQARELLKVVCADEPNNENAWLWLAGVSDKPEEASANLQQVLRLNPNNQRAKAGLEYYQSRQTATPPNSTAPAVRPVTPPAEPPTTPIRSASIPSSSAFFRRYRTAHFTSFTQAGNLASPVSRYPTLATM